jgi:AraC-like DNA-binding protein
VLGLLALAFGRPLVQHEEEQGAAQSARLRQIQVYIEAHLAEPELSPSRVAAANRVSLRYLYKLFKEADTSVAEWIRERRLCRCAEALASPTPGGRSIADIAFAWGFNDLSHFSRAFKQRFGVSPRDYRRARVNGRRRPASSP